MAKKPKKILPNFSSQGKAEKKQAYYKETTQAWLNEDEILGLAFKS